jgi:hypothetical protein
MRITSDQFIAGYLAIAVRNFLRKHELTGFIHGTGSRGECHT